MKITVKTLSGETFPLDVELSDTTLMIKQKIQAIKNFDVASQKLLRKGALLQDEKTVEQLGIAEGDFLVVMVNVKKQAPTQPSQQPQSQPQSQQPVQPQNQPQNVYQAPQPSTQAPVVGDSSLLSGGEYEKAINEMVSMGFSKEEAQAAMRAAFNNPERAIEYLLNGIPPGAGQGAPSQVGPGVGVPPVANPGNQQGGQAQVLAQLMQSPQFQQIRALAHQNPQAFVQMMPQLMAAIQQQNPQIHQFIQQNPEAFLQAIIGNGGGGGGNQVHISLTEEEKIQIDNMVVMGFNKQDALEAFLACDRNAEIALNYLFEKQANGDLLSQHIEREQNDPQNHPGPGEGDGDGEPGDDDDDIYH